MVKDNLNFKKNPQQRSGLRLIADKDCHHLSCDTYFSLVTIIGNKDGMEFPTFSIHKTQGTFQGNIWEVKEKN